MDRREKRLDGLDGGWRGHDFLSQVREVCRLRTDQDRSTVGAEIIERSRGAGGAEFEHLVVRYTRGPDVEDAAREHHIWLRSFAEYQHVWEHHGYLAAQTQRLRADPEYPLQRHVDKRSSELGEATARPTTAAEQIMDLLDTDGPRFVLVLGDFGTGNPSCCVPWPNGSPRRTPSWSRCWSPCGS